MVAAAISVCVRERTEAYHKTLCIIVVLFLIIKPLVTSGNQMLDICMNRGSRIYDISLQLCIYEHEVWPSAVLQVHEQRGAQRGARC